MNEIKSRTAEGVVYSRSLSAGHIEVNGESKRTSPVTTSAPVKVEVTEVFKTDSFFSYDLFLQLVPPQECATICVFSKLSFDV